MKWIFFTPGMKSKMFLFNRCMLIVVFFAILPVLEAQKRKLSPLFMNSNFTENDIKANINKQEIRNYEIEKIIINTNLKKVLWRLWQIWTSVIVFLSNLVFLHVGLCSFLNIFFAPCCFRP